MPMGPSFPIWEKSRLTPRHDVTNAPNRFGAFVVWRAMQAA
jgi:hypothetical protein